jgi:hypothetical protein
MSSRHVEEIRFCDAFERLIERFLRYTLLIRGNLVPYSKAVGFVHRY